MTMRKKEANTKRRGLKREVKIGLFFFFISIALLVLFSLKGNSITLGSQAATGAVIGIGEDVNSTGNSSEGENRTLILIPGIETPDTNSSGSSNSSDDLDSSKGKERAPILEIAPPATANGSNSSNEVNSSEEYSTPLSAEGEIFLAEGGIGLEGDANSTSCGYVNGDVVLAQNLDTPTTCFVVNTSNVVIDGNGFTVEGSQASLVYGVNVTGFSNVTIKNLNLHNFSIALFMHRSQNSTIFNNTANNSSDSLVELRNVFRLNFSQNTIFNATNEMMTITSVNYSLFDNNTIYGDDNLMLFTSSNSFFTNITRNNFTIASGPASLSGISIIDAGTNGRQLSIANNTFNIYHGTAGIENGLNNNITNNTFYVNPVSTNTDAITIGNANLILGNTMLGSTQRSSGIGWSATGSDLIIQENFINMTGSLSSGISFTTNAGTNHLIVGNIVIINNTNVGAFPLDFSSSSTASAVIINNTFINPLKGAQINIGLSSLSSLTLINNTYNLSNVSYDTNPFHRNYVQYQWWAVVNITAPNGTPISDANVSAFNLTREMEQSFLTDDRGVIKFNLTEKKENRTADLFLHTPHVINVSAAGYLPNSTTVNLSATQSVQINLVLAVNDTVNCGYINGNINLTNNINTGGSCFVVNASDIIVDGKGYMVTGNRTGGFGVNVTSFNNVTIENMVLYNFTTAVFLTKSSNSTVFNITANISSDDGIRAVNSFNLSIIQNAVLNSSNEGIDLVRTNGSLLRNNTVNATDEEAILLTNAINNVIEGNRLMLTGTGAGIIGVIGFGSIFLGFNEITNNSIVTYRGDGAGVLNGRRNNYTNNTFFVYGGSEGIRYSTGSSDDNAYRGNTFTTFTEFADGFLGSSSPLNVTFEDNFMNITGSQGVGISFGSSSGHNHTFSRNIIYVNGTTSSAQAVDWTTDGAGGSYFINNTFITTKAQALKVRLTNSAGTLFFINNVFNNTNVSFGTDHRGLLWFQWYVLVNVTAANGTPLSGANVTAYNSSGRIEQTLLTEASGLARFNLTDYSLNGSSTAGASLIFNYFTPHTVNATLTNYIQSSTTVNISSTHSTQINLVLTEDTAPNVQGFNTPASRQNFTTGETIVFNASISDAGIIDVVRFQIENGTNGLVNVTASSTNSTLYNFSITIGSGVAEGNRTITIFANDTVGNMNNSVSRTFFVDQTAPNATVTCSPSSVTVGSAVSCSCAGEDDQSSGVNTVSFSDTSPSTTTAGTFTTGTCTVTDNVGINANATGSYTVTAAASTGESSGGGGGGGSGAAPAEETGEEGPAAPSAPRTTRGVATPSEARQLLSEQRFAITVRPALTLTEPERQQLTPLDSALTGRAIGTPLTRPVERRSLVNVRRVSVTFSNTADVAVSIVPAIRERSTIQLPNQQRAEQIVEERIRAALPQIVQRPAEEVEEMRREQQEVAKVIARAENLQAQVRDAESIEEVRTIIQQELELPEKRDAEEQESLRDLLESKTLAETEAKIDVLLEHQRQDEQQLSLQLVEEDRVQQKVANTIETIKRVEEEKVQFISTTKALPSQRGVFFLPTADGSVSYSGGHTTGRLLKTEILNPNETIVEPGQTVTKDYDIRLPITLTPKPIKLSLTTGGEDLLTKEVTVTDAVRVGTALTIDPEQGIIDVYVLIPKGDETEEVSGKKYLLELDINEGQSLFFSSSRYSEFFGPYEIAKDQIFAQELAYDNTVYQSTLPVSLKIYEEGILIAENDYTVDFSTGTVRDGLEPSLFTGFTATGRAIFAGFTNQAQQYSSYIVDGALLLILLFFLMVGVAYLRKITLSALPHRPMKGVFPRTIARYIPRGIRSTFLERELSRIDRRLSTLEEEEVSLLLKQKGRIEKLTMSQEERVITPPKPTVIPLPERYTLFDDELRAVEKSISKVEDMATEKVKVRWHLPPLSVRNAFDERKRVMEKELQTVAEKLQREEAAAPGVKREIKRTKELEDIENEINGVESVLMKHGKMKTTIPSMATASKDMLHERKVIIDKELGRVTGVLARAEKRPTSLLAQLFSRERRRETRAARLAMRDVLRITRRLEGRQQRPSNELVDVEQRLATLQKMSEKGQKLNVRTTIPSMQEITKQVAYENARLREEKAMVETLLKAPMRGKEAILERETKKTKELEEIEREIEGVESVLMKHGKMKTQIPADSPLTQIGERKKAIDRELERVTGALARAEKRPTSLLAQLFSREGKRETKAARTAMKDVLKIARRLEGRQPRPSNELMAVEQQLAALDRMKEAKEKIKMRTTVPSATELTKVIVEEKNLLEEKAAIENILGKIAGKRNKPAALLQERKRTKELEDIERALTEREIVPTKQMNVKTTIPTKIAPSGMDSIFPRPKRKREGMERQQPRDTAELHDVEQQLAMLDKIAATRVKIRKLIPTDQELARSLKGEDKRLADERMAIRGILGKIEGRYAKGSSQKRKEERKKELEEIQQAIDSVEKTPTKIVKMKTSIHQHPLEDNLPLKRRKRMSTRIWQWLYRPENTQRKEQERGRDREEQGSGKKQEQQKQRPAAKPSRELEHVQQKLARLLEEGGSTGPGIKMRTTIPSLADIAAKTSREEMDVIEKREREAWLAKRVRQPKDHAEIRREKKIFTELHEIDRSLEKVEEIMARNRKGKVVTSVPSVSIFGSEMAMEEMLRQRRPFKEPKTKLSFRQQKELTKIEKELGVVEKEPTKEKIHVRTMLPSPEIRKQRDWNFLQRQRERGEERGLYVKPTPELEKINRRLAQVESAFHLDGSQVHIRETIPPRRPREHWEMERQDKRQREFVEISEKLDSGQKKTRPFLKRFFTEKKQEMVGNKERAVLYRDEGGRKKERRKGIRSEELREIEEELERFKREMN
ncbi:hypothetical protein HYT55_00640 [Candidatus Woesearchaeota archaeon]|nr:hypothetical protein [Candidatus Woesearchaeota archaeon]